MIRAAVSSVALLGAVACGAPHPAPAAAAPPAPAPSAEPRAMAPPAGTALAAAPPVAPPPAADAGAAKSKDRLTQISARHVLIQWMGSQSAAASVVRTREQALRVAEDVLRRAKGGEDFARLAVEYSDEPNAGNRGGSLGRFGHGQMVKQFEDAAFALGVGEISGIVETPFGFHIIQRTE